MLIANEVDERRPSIFDHPSLFFESELVQIPLDPISQQQPIDKYQKYKSLINHPDIWKMVMNAKDHDFGRHGYDFNRIFYYDDQENKDIHIPISINTAKAISQLDRSNGTYKENEKKILLEEATYNPVFLSYLEKSQNKIEKFGFVTGEYGYMGNMLNALSYMFENLGKKMTPGEYVKLHDLAVDNVTNMASNQNGFRKGTVGFGLKNGKDGNFSEQGFKEWQEKKASIWESDKLTIIPDSRLHKDMWPGIKQFQWDYGEEANLLMFIKKSEDINFEEANFYPNFFENCEKACQTVFDEYYEMMEKLKQTGTFPGCKNEKASLEDKKLEIIARICQNLDQMHLFSDGNIRTIGFLLLNKFLIENDLSPTIMYDPNMIDLRSTLEIIHEIKDGQKYFQHTFSMGIK